MMTVIRITYVHKHIHNFCRAIAVDFYLNEINRTLYIENYEQQCCIIALGRAGGLTRQQISHWHISNFGNNLIFATFHFSASECVCVRVSLDEFHLVFCCFLLFRFFCYFFAFIQKRIQQRVTYATFGGVQTSRLLPPLNTTHTYTRVCLDGHPAFQYFSISADFVAHFVVVYFACTTVIVVGCHCWLPLLPLSLSSHYVSVVIASSSCQRQPRLGSSLLFFFSPCLV